MASAKVEPTKISISLQENGVHSLWRGIEAFAEYTRSQEKMLIKDAVMFLHHGVELLMKQILVKTSQFLIFEDLRDAANKQKQADKAGVSIFFINKPPRTVSFEEAINRVEAFLKPIELTDELKENLSKLNQLRNQIEHHEIEVDQEEVTRLLASIHNPLLELLETQIGGIKRLQTPTIQKSWTIIHMREEFYSQLEKEVFETVRRFRGQRVPGRLFNMDDDVTLPHFKNVLANPIIDVEDVRFEVDILGESDASNWVIEVKGRTLYKNTRNALGQIKNISIMANAVPWIVVFESLSTDFRKFAKQLNVLATGEDEWQQLKNLLS